MKSPKLHADAPRAFAALVALAALASAACFRDPTMGDRNEAGDKWFKRAHAAYQVGDFDDASKSIREALRESGGDTETRILAARLALGRLDYAEALRVTEGMDLTAAHAIRGRARWYAGELEEAADELELVTHDATTKDPWAADVAVLARRGAGRHPFAMEGGIVSVTAMPAAGAAMVVPCQIDGQRAFALVATASGDVIVDSADKPEPSWVSIRLDQIDVNDVPALTADLSPFTRQLGAPIKALLGINFLRHVHATFDRHGDQFIVRRGEVPPPPNSAPLPLFYLRGGGLLLSADVSTDGTGRAPLLVDSTRAFPISLVDPLWRKAGLDPERLDRDQTNADVRVGELPRVRVVGFEIPRVPGFEGPSVLPAESGEDIELGGILGAGLLAEFRVTFGNDGRIGWLEPDPTLAGGGGGPVPDGSGPGAGPNGGDPGGGPPQGPELNAPPPRRPGT